jgi:hypothetical protein
VRPPTDAPLRSSTPSGAVSKAKWKQGITNWTPRCVICHGHIKGPGDRCPTHREQLRLRRKRKPR